MGWVINATARPLYPREWTRYPLYRGLGEPRAVLDECGKFRLHRDSIRGLSNPYQVRIPTTLCRPLVKYALQSVRRWNGHKYIGIRCFLKRVVCEQMPRWFLVNDQRDAQFFSMYLSLFLTLYKWTSDLHTTRPPTQGDSSQRLYWHNLSLLMMSTMCSKHVDN